MLTRRFSGEPIMITTESQRFSDSVLCLSKSTDKVIKTVSYFKILKVRLNLEKFFTDNRQSGFDTWNPIFKDDFFIAWRSFEMQKNWTISNVLKKIYLTSWEHRQIVRQKTMINVLLRVRRTLCRWTKYVCWLDWDEKITKTSIIVQIRQYS
jgi:hypothetical protein